jgi:hypothetical protein
MGTYFYFEERIIRRLMKMHLLLQNGISSNNVAFAMISCNLVKADEQKSTLLSTWF